jgi:hypothetical protein
MIRNGGYGYQRVTARGYGMVLDTRISDFSSRAIAFPGWQCTLCHQNELDKRLKRVIVQPTAFKLTICAAICQKHALSGQFLVQRLLHEFFQEPACRLKRQKKAPPGCPSGARFYG